MDNAGIQILATMQFRKFTYDHQSKSSVCQ